MYTITFCIFFSVRPGSVKRETLLTKNINNNNTAILAWPSTKCARITQSKFLGPTRRGHLTLLFSLKNRSWITPYLVFCTILPGILFAMLYRIRRKKAPSKKKKKNYTNLNHYTP